MNNDRLKLEQTLLERQNNRLRNQLYLSIGILTIIILLLLIWRGARIIFKLKKSNTMLMRDKTDSERALKELSGLAYYENLSETESVSPLKLNGMCIRLTDIAQSHCRLHVSIVYQTAFDDDFELKTHPDALTSLLSYLLHAYVQIAQKGSIRLNCTETGENIQLSVSDDNHVPISMNLSVCQTVAKRLHGRLWQDLDYSKGTRFCLEIPKTIAQ
jgi:hypothetical protein